MGQISESYFIDMAEGRCPTICTFAHVALKFLVFW